MKQINNEVVIPISLIMIKCQWWLSALFGQIDRVEKNMNSDIYEKQVQRMADDHFLKISLKKLYEWLIEFDKYVEEFENILKKLNSLNDIKLLRDVSEHEVDYYKQRGNKQKEFLNKEYNQSIIRPVIIDGDYYIGGKISIRKLKSILQELKTILNNNSYNFKYESILVLGELMKEPTI